MAIKSEKISGKLILNEYDSSNLKNSKYDVETNELVVEFKKGGKYSYENVPLSIFTKMRMAESQGSYFAKNISKTCTAAAITPMYVIRPTNSRLVSSKPAHDKAPSFKT